LHLNERVNIAQAVLGKNCRAALPLVQESNESRKNSTGFIRGGTVLLRLRQRRGDGLKTGCSLGIG